MVSKSLKKLLRLGRWCREGRRGGQGAFAFRAPAPRPRPPARCAVRHVIQESISQSEALVLSTKREVRDPITEMTPGRS